MSMIGNFGLCTKNNCDNLVMAMEDGRFDTAEDLIKKIYGELEDSASALENDLCSGEVFIALFQYFKTEFGINMRENAERGKLGESWREITGDYDMAVFEEKEKAQLLSLADQIDYDKVTQFVNDFFGNDYGNAGRTACDAFFGNLRKLKADHVLIWHLF